MIAKTPSPPYYAVIFTSVKKEDEGYAEMAARMNMLAAEQEGFLGMESARNEVGITVSYWESTEAIIKWKMQAEHLEAQRMGRSSWYSAYQTRVCLVERDYAFSEGDSL